MSAGVESEMLVGHVHSAVTIVPKQEPTINQCSLVIPMEPEALSLI